MADRYWVGGTGNWDNTTTTRWSATSGGAGGASVPTASDNVYFDANSGGGTCTVTVASRPCLNLSFRGLSGTSDYTGTLSVSGTSSIIVSGSLTFASPASMTLNYTSSNFTLSSALSNTITFNGQTFGGGFIVTGGGTWTCQDIVRVVGGLFLNQGTFTTTYDLYVGQISSSITGLVKAFNITGANLYLTGTGTLLSPNTTTLTWNADVDYYITDSSATSKTLSIISPYITTKNIYFGGSGSGVLNFQASLGTVSLIVTNTGGASINFFQSTSISSLIFQSGTNAALVQTTASRNLTITKDLTFTSTQGTMSGVLAVTTFTAAATGTANITLAGKSFVSSGNFVLNNASGVFNFLDAFSCSSSNVVLTAGTYNVYSTFSAVNSLILTAGTLNCNSNNFTLFAFSSTTSNVRALNIGTNATWTIIGSIASVGGYVWDMQTTTNLSYTATNFTAIFTDTTTTIVRIIAFTGLFTNIYVNRGASTGTFFFGNTDMGVVNFIDNGTAAHTIQFTQSRTYTFGHFVVKGSTGNVVTINTNGITCNLVKSPLGLVSCDYVAVSNISATSATNTWYAGANSTISGTTGWILSYPPTRKLGAGGVG